LQILQLKCDPFSGSRNKVLRRHTDRRISAQRRILARIRHMKPFLGTKFVLSLHTKVSGSNLWVSVT